MFIAQKAVNDTQMRLIIDIGQSGSDENVLLSCDGKSIAISFSFVSVRSRSMQDAGSETTFYSAHFDSLQPVSLCESFWPDHAVGQLEMATP